MNYVRADGDAVIAFPYTFAMLQADNPDVSFPRTPAVELWAEYGAYPVLESLPPIEEGKRAIEALPVLSDGTWVQGWTLENLPRREIPKWLIISRLTDQQLEEAFALMTLRQVERWRAAAFPNIYADDPDMIAILSAIAADPAVVLAPEQN